MCKRHQQPTNEEHIRALILVAGEYATHLVKYIETHGNDDYIHRSKWGKWTREALEGATTIQRRLEMLHQAGSRSQLLLLKRMKLTVDAINEFSADYWSGGLSQLLQLIIDRMKRRHSKRLSKPSLRLAVALC